MTANGAGYAHRTKDTCILNDLK